MSLLERAAPTTAVECRGLPLMQLNVEGLTTAKLNVIEQIAIKNKVTITLLQETHKENKNFLKLLGYTQRRHGNFIQCR